MQLEVILLFFVRSLREGNFKLYIESQKKLAPWMFALDHINYAHWLPIHLRDMLLLKHKHPEICAAFQDGGFVVQPSNKPFSAIFIDQAHEMNNKVIKGDGGIIGLTENKSALERWLRYVHLRLIFTFFSLRSVTVIAAMKTKIHPSFIMNKPQHSKRSSSKM